MARKLGYCTNVHAGATLRQTLDNLDTHAAAVKAIASPDRPLGIGLWLSAAAAREAVEQGPERLRDRLADRGLDVFTINGFPWGDFHRDRVKHDVYRPDWTTPQRVEYTLDLARLLAAIVPEGGRGGISTLPLGWRAWMDDAAADACAGNLARVVGELAAIEAGTGRLIHLDLEPEPGCRLQRSGDVVELFERHLPATDEIFRHLRVCHDVCHAAVMFETQRDAISAYDAAGLTVGKVQVSSAIAAQVDRRLAAELGTWLAEPRYLHQTVVRDATGRSHFHDDLPAAVAAGVEGEWRIHYHVPIHLDAVGPLGTTRTAIDEVIELLGPRPEVEHWEVETYAWDVLPTWASGTLAEDVAAELAYLAGRLPAGAAT